MRTNWDLKAALIAISLALSAVGSFCALADTSPDEAGVILSNLPAKGTLQYKKLSDLAGATGAQDLDMTQAEMWNVPRARLDAFLAAAKSQGVGVKRLDQGLEPPRHAYGERRQDVGQAEGHDAQVHGVEGGDGHAHDGAP